MAPAHVSWPSPCTVGLLICPLWDGGRGKRKGLERPQQGRKWKPYRGATCFHQLVWRRRTALPEGVTWEPGCRPAMQGAGLATQATFILMQRLWGVPQRQELKKASKRSRKETTTSHREIYTGD